MEQIYTVRVKCEPNPELNYPSERAYSSSTVGGLALAHLTLAALSLTLCSIRYSSSYWRGEYLGGAILIGGATLAGLVGLLAYKKWYIDRHIRWFLLVSLVSAACAFTSSILAISLLVQPDEYGGEMRPVSGNNTDEYGIGENLTESITYDMESGRSKREIPQSTGGAKHELTVHILLASLVELAWSILSVKIAWKGVRNSYGKKGGGNKGSDKRPDILRSVEPKFSNYSDVVKELCRLQKTSGLALGETGKKIVSGFYATRTEGDGLPLPESHQEYRQRIEQFLESSNCHQSDSGIS